MAEINDLSTTDASNTARFPENMNPGAVNDGARALEGILARYYKDTNGSVTTAGTSTAYTATANQTLSAYYDGLLLVLDFHVASGASPTLNVDSLGARNLQFHDGTAVAANDIPAGAKVLVVYDGTQFQVLSPAPPASGATLGSNTFTGEQTFQDQIMQAIGTTEASATTTALDGDGNIYPISGTASITSVTGVKAGGVYIFVATGAWSIANDGDNIIIDTSSSYTMAVGQVSVWYAHANDKITYVAGHPFVASQAALEAASNTSLAVTPGRQHFHPSAAKAWVVFDSSGTLTVNTDYNVTSVTDNAVGRYTVNIDNDFSSTDYAVAGWGGNDNSGTNHVCVIARSIDDANRTAGACPITSWAANNGIHADFDTITVVFFGDL